MQLQRAEADTEGKPHEAFRKFKEVAVYSFVSRNPIFFVVK
jgi:hypothetical protein